MGAVVIAFAILGAAGLMPGAAVAAPAGSAAKTCSNSYVDATVDGAQKCLRDGAYCARADGSQYKHYGFACTSVGGTYRLEAARGRSAA
jgi:hypothetical protein